MRRLERLARATPASRERYIDLLRAVAITAVVLGHWLIVSVGRDANGQLTGRSALPYLPWAYPITWLVQVIPLFFLVGGYANAASLVNAWRRGRRSSDWLLRRADRLVRPTAVLLLVLLVASLGATLFGADPTRVRTVVWFATIPLWFLSAYLMVVALTPVTYRLHRRFGLALPVVLLALVALGDLARLYGPAALAAGNYLFGWIAIHQLGFAWRDAHTGRAGTTGEALFGYRSTRSGVILTLGGLAALVLLTGPGPYPVSMIDVPGQLRNAAPPTVALLAVAVLQLGLALTFQTPARRWLRRDHPWTAVVAVNAVVLTIFLWHIGAAVLVIGGIDAIGLLPTTAVGSPHWWLWRLPWLVVLTLALAVLVFAFGPVEIRSSRRRTGPAPAGDDDATRTGPAGGSRPTATRAGPRSFLRSFLAVAGYAAIVCGLLDNNLTPRSAPEPLGVPVTALVAFGAGVSLLRLAAHVDNRR